jgi:hypothetical protein
VVVNALQWISNGRSDTTEVKDNKSVSDVRGDVKGSLNRKVKLSSVECSNSASKATAIISDCGSVRERVQDRTFAERAGVFRGLRGRFALLPAMVNHGSKWIKAFPNREVSIMEW